MTSDIFSNCNLDIMKWLLKSWNDRLQVEFVLWSWPTWGTDTNNEFSTRSDKNPAKTTHRPWQCTDMQRQCRVRIDMYNRPSGFYSRLVHKYFICSLIKWCWWWWWSWWWLSLLWNRLWTISKPKWLDISVLSLVFVNINWPQGDISCFTSYQLSTDVRSTKTIFSNFRHGAPLGQPKLSYFGVQRCVILICLLNTSQIGKK